MNVLRAIILREVRVRYADRRLGYLWAVLGPLIHISVYVALFSIMGRTSPIEQPMAIFFGSSILPWLLFTGIIARVSKAPSANKALLVYPHIFPVDFMMGRLILEVATCVTVLVILLFAAYFFYGFTIVDPLKMLAAWMTIALLGAGIGMINAIMETYTETYEDFFKPFMRFIYFTAGIFFIVGNMPSVAQDALAWNPMLHLIDWFRAGALSGYRTDFYKPLPVMMVSLAFFLTGLMLERLRRQELRTP